MIAIPCMVMALGLWLLVSAMANWDWYKAIVDFAAVEALFGEDVARWLCGIIGLGLMGGSIFVLIRMA